MMSGIGIEDPLIEAYTFHLQRWKPFNTPKPKPKPKPKRTYTTFSIDISKLSLYDSSSRCFSTKRRRRYASSRSRSRSMSCSKSLNGTCSDLPIATDSSGDFFTDHYSPSHLFTNNNNNHNNIITKEDTVLVNPNNVEVNDSGYGTEPGYRGDAEIGYGDEEDDESKDKTFFWGDDFIGSGSQLEMVGENSMQKTHHRGRRKKQDVRMVDAPR